MNFDNFKFKANNTMLTCCIYTNVTDMFIWEFQLYVLIQIGVRKNEIFKLISKFQTLSQEPQNQYQACLYSFVCIFYSESKYGNEILNFEKKFERENFGLTPVLGIHLDRVKLRGPGTQGGLSLCFEFTFG